MSDPSHKTNISVTITGATTADVQRTAREFAGETALSSVSNDDLLAELRDRFAKLSPPMVIRVEPFESNSATAETDTKAETAVTAKAEKAAQKAAAKAATDAALKEAAEKAAATKAAAKEPPKETVAGTQTPAGGGDWDGDEASTDAPTVDDVKAALNACSATKGQAATREIMKQVGGSMRLLDVPAEKYADLIEKLKEAA